MSMRAIFGHRYTVWFLLALPAIGFTFALSSGSVSVEEMVHPSGEFSARAMILAMLCSPLVAVFPRVSFFKSLMRRRRYFGVAAFGYALFHTILYLIEKGTFDAVLGEATELAIWTGWVAFFIFVPLAMTSHDSMMRRMGARNWKRLQQTTYVAAVLTVMHWLFLDYQWAPVLVHFLPLALLEIARIAKRRGSAKGRQQPLATS
jgi:sulfoxide reductase heme-binding subunit YedZ